MEDQKLTAEELKNLQELNQSFNSKKMNIADGVYQQALLIRELDTLREKFSVLEVSLSDKYGKDAVIDLSTGNVKYPDPAEEKEETDTPFEVVK